MLGMVSAWLGVDFKKMRGGAAAESERRVCFSTSGHSSQPVVRIGSGFNFFNFLVPSPEPTVPSSALVLATGTDAHAKWWLMHFPSPATPDKLFAV